MRKVLVILMAMLLAALPAGVLAEEEMVAMPNPVHEVASYDELVAAVPGVAIYYPPEDATEMTFCWIEGEQPILQIQFAWGEDYYTYRAAFCASEDAMQDIDGVYLDFDHTETLTGLFDTGFPINLRAYEEDTYAVTDWFIPNEQTQMSLFSETAGAPDMHIVELTEMLIPHDADGDGDVADDWPLNDDE